MNNIPRKQGGDDPSGSSSPLSNKRFNKCPVCKIRQGKTRHARDGNHKNTNRDNTVWLCFWCHQGMNVINNRMGLDFEYILKNKVDLVLREANRLIKKNGRGDG